MACGGAPIRRSRSNVIRRPTSTARWRRRASARSSATTHGTSAWAANWARAARFTSLRGDSLQTVVIADVRAHHPIGQRHMVAEPATEEIDELSRDGAPVRQLTEELSGTTPRRVVLALVPLDFGATGRPHQPLLVRKMLFQRSEEHTSELQSPYVISYAVFCLKKHQQDPGTMTRFGRRSRGASHLPRAQA